MREIAWINTYARVVGGCERYIASTAAALQAMGYRNTLFYDPQYPSDPSFLDLFDAAYPLIDPARQISADILYVHQWDAHPLSLFTHLGMPVVRFFHDHQLLCLRKHKITGVTRRPCDKPTGLRCYPCMGFVQRNARPRLLSALRKEQRSLHNYGKLIVGSHYMAEALADEGFPREQIAVHPLYPTPSQATVPTESDLLLYAGRLSAEKGLLALLEELATVTAPYRLAIAGVGPQRKQLESRCKQLDIPATFLGQLQAHELAHWQQKAALLLFPCGRPEPFGLAGVEAMQQGTPVIATNLGAVSEWLDHEENGLLVEYGQSWKGPVEQLLNNPALAERMGEQAKKLRFTQQAHVTGLLSTFEVLARPRYAPMGSEAAQRTIGGIIGEVRDLIAACVPAGQLHAFLLTGSYGRGEGGVRNEGPHNDIDFLLVTKRLSRKKQRALKERIDTLLDPLRHKHAIGLVIGVIGRHTLRFGRARLAWYEIRHAHQRLLGDGKLHFSNTIPSADIHDLALNRGTLLVINRVLMRDTERYRETIIRHIHKAIVGFGDALLFIRGGYHWSYLERERRMRTLVPEIATLYSESMGFRLTADYELYFHRDLKEWMKETEQLLERLYGEIAPIRGRGKLADLFPTVAFGNCTLKERTDYLNLWGCDGDPNFHKMLERTSATLEVAGV